MSDTGLRNISLQLQGQTGGDELGPEGLGGRFWPRAEGWKGHVGLDKHFRCSSLNFKGLLSIAVL